MASWNNKNLIKYVIPSKTQLHFTLQLLKVLEVIRALEEHKKKCENEGNYMEARAAAQRLNGVKVFLWGIQ